MDAIDAQVGLNTDYYISLLSFSILYYDYLLTFSMEVDRFWTVGWHTWASFLFFLNRYLTLFGHIPIVFEFFWVAPNSVQKVAVSFGYLCSALQLCHSLQLFHQYYVVAVQLAVGALLILRTYALYDRNRNALIILLSTAAIVVAFGCWAIYSSKRTDPVPQALPLIGCRKILTLDESKRLAAAWSGSLFFDVLIFGMTVYRSLTRHWSGSSRKLIKVLLRDGAFYFAVMALSSLANILTFLVAPPYERGVTVTFTNIISSTLISRLVLRLRNPKLARKALSHEQPSQLTATNHRPVVSTIVALDTVLAHESDAWCSAGNSYTTGRHPETIGIALVSRDG